jgi:hypothetical protein
MRSKPWPPPSAIAPSPSVTPPSPPRDLAGPGRDVWDRITREFHIDDCAAQEVLQQVCEAVNRLRGHRGAGAHGWRGHQRRQGRLPVASEFA